MRIFLQDKSAEPSVIYPIFGAFFSWFSWSGYAPAYVGSASVEMIRPRLRL